MSDSVERIKADAIKLVSEYWNCANVYRCIDCPSKIGAERPFEYYGTFNCAQAMNLDIVERTIKVMDSRMERTCHMELRKHGANYDVFYFDCCDKEYAESKTDKYASFVIGNVCPYCGARVVL